MVICASPRRLESPESAGVRSRVHRKLKIRPRRNPPSRRSMGGCSSSARVCHTTCECCYATGTPSRFADRQREQWTAACAPRPRYPPLEGEPPASLAAVRPVVGRDAPPSRPRRFGVPFVGRPTLSERGLCCRSHRHGGRRRHNGKARVGLGEARPTGAQWCCWTGRPALSERGRASGPRAGSRLQDGQRLGSASPSNFFCGSDLPVATGPAESRPEGLSPRDATPPRGQAAGEPQCRRLSGRG